MYDKIVKLEELNKLVAVYPEEGGGPLNLA